MAGSLPCPKTLRYIRPAMFGSLAMLEKEINKAQDTEGRHTGP